MRVNHQAFFCSLFFARLADQILLFLVPLVVFQTTQKVSWSGIAFFLEALPRYLFFPVLWRAQRPLLAAQADAYQPDRAGGGVHRGRAGLRAVRRHRLADRAVGLCGVLTSQGLVAREVMLPQIFKHKIRARAGRTRNWPTSSAWCSAQWWPHCCSASGAGSGWWPQPARCSCSPMPPLCCGSA